MKKLGFGLMRLPLMPGGSSRDVDMNVVKLMADVFMDNGFTYFDTAYMYHNYFSEAVFRRTVVPFHARDSYTVADKMPTIFLRREEDMPEIFERQLRRCGVDYFDYYMMHDVNMSNYDSTVQRLGEFEFLLDRKREGLVRHVGFSYHDDAVLLDRILTEHPEAEFVQLQINYMDWDSDSIQSRLCYETAVRHGKRVIAMEPVKGGTLASVPEAAEMIFRDRRPDMSPASWAIRYSASLPEVMVVLSGMSNMSQLCDNVGYMKDFVPLDDGDYKTVESALNVIRGAMDIPCTGCGYCLEGCPKNIAIPKYFALYNTEHLLGSRDFSTQQEYYSNITETHGRASDCIRCGKCEKIRPQHLTIRDCLEDVADMFER